ncbi:MAG: HAD-IA family hydrolase [Bacteroidales bacterium]|nr:HAD-IA family hydrolase [Bacteroidales bacterium]
MFQTQILNFLKRHHYMRIEPEVALIDMDGTLYDSMPNHARAWYQMVQEYDIPCTPEEFYLYEGRTGASTINLLFQRTFGHDATPEQIEEMYHRKTVIFASMPEPKPMPGAAEMLRFLKEVGIRRVLVTGSGQNSLLQRLDRDFPGIFSDELKVTARDVVHGKPHPEPFLKALEKAGVHASHAIAIENAPLGVKSADDAGVFTLGVTTGPIPAIKLIEAGAGLTFPSMTDLASQLPMLIYSLMTTSNNLN